MTDNMIKIGDELVCSRCGEIIDGEFICKKDSNEITATCGFYIVSHGTWKKFAVSNESILCDNCMWTSDLYMQEYGNIFETTIPPKEGYTILIDGEQFTVRNSTMKVGDILAISGIRNPEKYYVCRIRKGKVDKEFRETDQSVPIYKNAKFVSVCIRPESYTA